MEPMRDEELNPFVEAVRQKAPAVADDVYRMRLRVSEERRRQNRATQTLKKLRAGLTEMEVALAPDGHGAESEHGSDCAPCGIIKMLHAQGVMED